MSLVSTAILYSICAASPAMPPESDPFDQAVEVLRFSFENDARHDYDGDKDYDGLPDDWTRRRGPTYPGYVHVEIDRHRGKEGNQSLRFHVNGGAVAFYSPITRTIGRIDHTFAYVFQGYIRTQLLENDAALISISFLNHRRERVQRFLSKPVTGTHNGWVRVRLGPMTPTTKDVHFVVVGCHLLQGKSKDVRGSVWFDDLWVGKLPRMTLVTNFAAHFRKRNEPIQITARVSGLGHHDASQLDIELSDSGGVVLQHETRRVAAETKQQAAIADPDAGSDEITETWTIAPLDPGFYRVRAKLTRNRAIIRREETTFAVMDLMNDNRPGEFGWSIRRVPRELVLDNLPYVAFQGGINWLKYPLWGSDDLLDPQKAAEISSLFERLNRRQISPVGLLSDPPMSVREKFSREWSGISEVFAMPSGFWYPSLEPIVTRFASNVWHWQIGSDADVSFVGTKKLAATLAAIKRQFDSSGRDTHVGVHWTWDQAMPDRGHLTKSFLSVCNETPLTGPELIAKLRTPSSSTQPRWVVVKPLSKSNHTPEERAANLVKRMVAAKIGGADAIFSWDVFDDEYGLLHDDGSPSTLFLPWRTTALTLQGAKYLGSLQLPNGSENHVFMRDDAMFVVLWNERSTEQDPVTETLYLGEDVLLNDVWGRQQRLERDGGKQRQVVPVSPLPVTLSGCSAPVVQWRLAVQFEKGKIRSEYGGHEEAIRGMNTFHQGINGTATLNVPHDWEVEPKSWELAAGAGEPFRMPMMLSLPPDASLGSDDWSIDFQIAADRQYQFRVHRPYEVGMGDILISVADRKLGDGRLEIEQVIVNKTNPTEVLNFRCSLSMEGRRRQKKFVTKLGNDEDHKLYHFPDAESLRGKKVWLRAEQVNGRRVLNKKLVVGEKW